MRRQEREKERGKVHRRHIGGFICGEGVRQERKKLSEGQPVSNEI